MKRIDTVPYTIGQHFAAYIAYGQVDELTEDEVADFELLELDARNNADSEFEFAHWSITDDTEEFARCDATGMMGACVIVEAVYFHREA